MKISELDALNITAIVSDKPGNDQWKCPTPGDHSGINVISVTYVPGDHRMYAGF